MDVMKLIFLAITVSANVLLSVFFFGCKNPPSPGSDSDSVRTTMNSVQINSFTLSSGRYGETSLAIDSSNNITGVYEYYDGWNDGYKEYMQICKFYFSGKLSNRD